MDHTSRQITDWLTAEDNAAAWMQSIGFVDARTTQTGPDGGIDIVATGAVAQVKFEARQVGRPQLQAFVGATYTERSRSRLFFTGTGYSAAAVEYANAVDLALFTYSLTGHVEPTNTSAHALIRQAAQSSTGELESPTRPDSKPGWSAPIWLVLALVFTWGIVGGIFNPINHKLEFEIVAGGLSILALAVLCWFLFARAVRARQNARRGGSVHHDPSP